MDPRQTPAETANPMHARDRRLYVILAWSAIPTALVAGCFIAWGGGQLPWGWAVAGISIGLLGMAGATIYALEKKPPPSRYPGPMMIAIAAITWGLIGWQGWMFFYWPKPTEQRDTWPGLTNAEASALAARVRFISAEDIVVACETIKCKDLADGIAEILQKTPGWKVSILHGGGIGITGVSGIQLNPSEPATEALRDAIQSTTTLQISIGPNTRKDMGTNQSVLVVGNKPF